MQWETQGALGEEGVRSGAASGSRKYLGALQSKQRGEGDCKGVWIMRETIALRTPRIAPRARSSLLFYALLADFQGGRDAVA